MLTVSIICVILLIYYSFKANLKSNQTKRRNTMKRILGLVTIIVLICCTLCGCLFGEDISSENARIKNSTDYEVFYNPVCPECDHISELDYVNLCEGENHTTAHVCEECYKVYNITITR